MTLHILNAEQQTLHGALSREYAPILTIDPGDTVRYTTLDARWGKDRETRIEPLRPNWRGHALTGPIAIRGAEPGMTLVVHIGELKTGSYGWNLAGGGAFGVNTELGVVESPQVKYDWSLDQAAGRATNQFGHSVAMRPFLGFLGVAPEEPGEHSTTPPRRWGGNIDCKELVAGSSLFLPVGAPGALFSCGDAHAAQGDGEVSCLAIECALTQADLTFGVLDKPLSLPRAHTPAGWVTMGFSTDLNEAMVQALDGMLVLMGELYGLERREALALASVAVDLRITQVVNQVRGVHAVLPHGAIQFPQK